MSDNIVFIHGAWLASNSWENFAAFFSERGYATLAPGWPRKAGDVPELRSSAEDLAAIPLRRLGTAREVGDVVAFLCSERASYVSGTVILVDGALTRGLW